MLSPEEINFSENQIYNKTFVTSEAGRVLGFLRNNGYAFATSEAPEVVKYESNNPEFDNKLTINLKYHMGERYRFGKTFIGIKNDKYSIDINDILYELEYSENDIYSKELLVKSENRLKQDCNFREHKNSYFEY